MIKYKRLLLFTTLLLASQARAYVTAFNLLYEAPDLIAPAILLQSDPDPLEAYSASLVGRTLSTRAARTFAPDWQLAGGLSMTPKCANGSDRFYEQTKRRKDLSYEDTEIKSDLSLIRRWGDWTLQIGGKVERHKLRDEALRAYWRKPHLGAFSEVSYRSVRSYDLYRQRLGGYEVRASVDSFFDPTPWQRLKLAYEGGSFWQKIYFARELTAFTGNQLNMVNKHLVGGSWDLPRVNKAYGSRLFQYRLERGVVVNFRADYPIFSDLDASIQLGYIATETISSLGMDLKVFMLYHGLLWEAGAAYQANSPSIFARLTFATL